MAYESNAADERDRSRNYVIMWGGLAGALVSFANLFLGFDNMLVVIAFGVMAGGMLQSALASSTDEYFHGLCRIGHRWLLAALALYLLAIFMLANGDLARSAGFQLAAGGMPSDDAPLIRPLFGLDAITSAVMASLIFYLGYTFAWLRDRFSGGTGK